MFYSYMDAKFGKVTGGGLWTTWRAQGKHRITEVRLRFLLTSESVSLRTEGGRENNTLIFVF